ncbi:MAG: response regulator, partial [Anaerolineae bacterium]
MTKHEASPQILLVDDVPENLHLLVQILGEQGYIVRPVTSGEMALKAVEAYPPDLILLDLRMPRMDGYQLCEILKADTRFR